MAPRYEEIKMDAEIGSYQVDPDEQPDAAQTGKRRIVGKWRCRRRRSFTSLM
jgi:hypothetical protein